MTRRQDLCRKKWNEIPDASLKNHFYVISEKITFTRRVEVAANGPSNFALYKFNGSRSLLSVCKERRLLWFGHAARQGPSSPTHQALLLAIDVSGVRRPRGRPPLRWIDTVRHDLSGVQLSVKDTMVHALNRKAWLHIVHRCVKLNWVTCDSVSIIIIIRSRNFRLPDDCLGTVKFMRNAAWENSKTDAIQAKSNTYAQVDAFITQVHGLNYIYLQYKLSLTHTIRAGRWIYNISRWIYVEASWSRL